MKPEEKRRYSRHLILPEIGEDGQRKLLDAKVLVIGAGGLGCPILQYLAAAGVGTLGIIDDDLVDESNLQRQIIYGMSDLGNPKALSAKRRLEDLNPGISINAFVQRLTAENAMDLLVGYDIVVDGSDNFSTRYLVNDACVLLGKPLVYGSIFKFSGQVSVFNYNGGPTYRCLFPEPPEQGEMPSCSEVGVLGVLPGLVGTRQALEVMKMILGIGDVLSGKLLMLDSLQGTETQLDVVRDDEAVRELIDGVRLKGFGGVSVGCSLGSKSVISAGVGDLRKLIDKPGALILDLREDYEGEDLPYSNVSRIAFSDVKQRLEELKAFTEIMVLCQVGVRSAVVADLLLNELQSVQVSHLKDGILAN